MKKIRKHQSVSALLIGLEIMISAVAPLVVAAPTLAQSKFTDVQGNWSQSCITQLASQGIISGYPDGTFRPNASVTRAEFAAMIGKAFSNAQRTRNPVQFVDVPANYWAYTAIETASQAGFLKTSGGALRHRLTHPMCISKIKYESDMATTFAKLESLYLVINLT
jgi:hypothetical protein